MRRYKKRGCIGTVLLFPFYVIYFAFTLCGSFLLGVLTFLWKLIKLPFKSKQPMTGIEYESRVADYLKSKGYWGVKVTQASGDYGIDVTAHKNGKKYAVQCKYYSQPVGIAAVQEAVAGKVGLRNRRGKAFTNNSLYAVLKNEKYTGVYLYKDKRIEGGMPRIVDDDTFWKVQEMLKINKRAPAHKWSKAEYLLTDKLFCGKCGSGMIGESGTSKTGAKHNYYSCSKKKRFRECDKKSIRQAIVEDLVINATIDLLKDDELIEFLIENTWQYYQAQDESQEELNALHRELEQTEKAIANLITAIEAGILNEATKKRMAELEAQQKDLVSAIADREIAKGFHITREYVDFFFRQFRDKDYTDRECQKQLISTFVNSVFLYDDHLKLNFNFSSDSRIISLSESEAADAGEVFVHCASCSTSRVLDEHLLFCRRLRR